MGQKSKTLRCLRLSSVPSSSIVPTVMPSDPGTIVRVIIVVKAYIVCRRTMCIARATARVAA